ncbi:MAG: sigma-70 family RNA polymerase sigma factor [Lacipirellulaceae bacterium]
MTQALGQEWVTKLSNSGEEQESALTELRELLRRRLERAFYSNAKVDEAFIEDAVQDGLLAVLDSLNDFQGRSQFTTWATTITIRIAMTEMRRRRWKDVSLDQLQESQPTAIRQSSSGSSAEGEMQRAQMIEKMQQIIREQLTDKQRIALQAELQGMPQEEIGRRTGSNRNAIYKLVHDARKRLKKGMLEAGYSREDLAPNQRTSR